MGRMKTGVYLLLPEDDNNMSQQILIAVLNGSFTYSSKSMLELHKQMAYEVEDTY